MLLGVRDSDIISITCKTRRIHPDTPLSINWRWLSSRTAARRRGDVSDLLAGNVTDWTTGFSTRSMQQC
jgi:hypothetical protein